MTAMTADEKAEFARMAAQVPVERMQVVVGYAQRGADPGELTDAERWFYDRAVARVAAHPEAVWSPLDL